MSTVGRPHGNAKYHLENCRCLPCRNAAAQTAAGQERAA